jgi:hypothetical protein
MNVQVTAYRPYQKNTLQGFLTVSFGGLLIKECTHHTKDGKEWIGFPAREFKGNDGARKWQNLVEFADGFDRDGFQAAAVQAIHRHLEAM